MCCWIQASDGRILEKTSWRKHPKEVTACEVWIYIYLFLINGSIDLLATEDQLKSDVRRVFFESL